MIAGMASAEPSPTADISERADGDPVPAVDLDEARQVLEIIGGPKAAFTFQVLRESGGTPCMLHGSLAQHSKRLSLENERGAFVGMVPQETDGAGRKTSNVK